MSVWPFLRREREKHQVHQLLFESLNSLFLSSGQKSKCKPGVTEEPVVLALLPPHQPLPEGGVTEHAAAVVAPQQEGGELFHAVCKLPPLQRSSGQGARIYHLEQLSGDTTVR